VSSGIDLALVPMGTLLYRRTASQLAKTAGRGAGAAATSAGLIALFGVVPLSMDLTAT
jgi:hypothetical protein